MIGLALHLTAGDIAGISFSFFFLFFCIHLPCSPLRSRPQRQGLRPKLHGAGMGLIHWPLRNGVGDDTPDGAAVSFPVPPQLQVNSQLSACVCLAR